MVAGTGWDLWPKNISGGAVEGRLLANASSLMRDRERGREPGWRIGEDGPPSWDGDPATSAGGNERGEMALSAAASASGSNVVTSGTKLDAGRFGDARAGEAGVDEVSRFSRRAGVGDSRYVWERNVWSKDRPGEKWGVGSGRETCGTCDAELENQVR